MAAPLPPASTNVGAFLDAEGTGITSYVWRYLVHGSRGLPRSLSEKLDDRPGRVAVQRELASHLLAAVRDELEARDLDWFIALCASPVPDAGLDDGPCAWESYLDDQMTALHIPVVSTRPWIEARGGYATQGDGALFVERGAKGAGHATSATPSAVRSTLGSSSKSPRSSPLET